MSSAILYLAIIAIWACVLIPRWLRRDPARGSSHVSGPAVHEDVVPADDLLDHDGASVPDDAARIMADVAEVNADADVDADADAEGEADSLEPDGAPPPLTPEESRQRMMAARRRLLGMMIALETAAIALAVLGLAALWVVVPPSVMLTGYLLLLREAAHADAERARREREGAWERERTRAARRAAASHAAPAAAAASAGPASPAAEYEDTGPGRDFAPGLAGKYTTSNAEVIPIPERAGEDLYDQYTQNKLRAVGD